MTSRSWLCPGGGPGWRGSEPRFRYPETMLSRAGKLLALAAATVCAMACQPSTHSTAAEANAGPRPASYVGGVVCAGCHADEATAWAGSHHDFAMQVAGPDTVLGDFRNTEFTYNGITSRFFRRGDEYWVRTDGPDGALANFRITRTFGVEPLQQYLIDFPGGRRQVLGIAWDSRPAKLGGQRWFHLHPHESIDHSDPLHWTGTLQNWNTMCAACHSTNFKKNYAVDTNTFASSFSSIDVDCEACHGPGSIHATDPRHSALALGSETRTWVLADDRGIAHRVPASNSHAEVEVCARCHSRRSQFGDADEPGKPLLDTFRPALLDSGLYYPDGQMRGEVYVYGSFLQSAMYRAGVTCSDCHDPHSARLRAQGNALCTGCHLAAKFDTPAHHHHSAPGGPACVDCHMRTETYMVVDARRDHSLRVPRPDLSARLGTPNACNDCHNDRTPQWAADAVATWYPNGRQHDFHYGEAIHAGQTWAADRARLLLRVIEDAQMPAIARATALTLLASQPDAAAADAIRRSLDDSDPLVQLAGLSALGDLPPEARISAAQPFLTHPLAALRMEAARVLAPARGALTEDRRRNFDAAGEEYIAAANFNRDRGEGYFNLGTFLADLGRLDEAQAAFSQGIAREPKFLPSYLNLADLYRAEGRETQGREVLLRAAREGADDAAVELALGFSLVRTGQTADALGRFARAQKLQPDRPYYAYVLGVALNSSGAPQRAKAVLTAARERFPGYRETLAALATIHRDNGENEEAARDARALLDLSPSDAFARELLRQVTASGPAP
jgi:predicted CXXCH cytochrome family protein